MLILSLTAGTVAFAVRKDQKVKDKDVCTMDNGWLLSNNAKIKSPTPTEPNEMCNNKSIVNTPQTQISSTATVRSETKESFVRVRISTDTLMGSCLCGRRKEG